VKTTRKKKRKTSFVPRAVFMTITATSVVPVCVSCQTDTVATRDAGQDKDAPFNVAETGFQGVADAAFNVADAAFSVAETGFQGVAGQGFDGSFDSPTDAPSDADEGG
jgi:hypothetical protein